MKEALAQLVDQLDAISERLEGELKHKNKQMELLLEIEKIKSQRLMIAICSLFLGILLTVLFFIKVGDWLILLGH